MEEYEALPDLLRLLVVHLRSPAVLVRGVDGRYDEIGPCRRHVLQTEPLITLVRPLQSSTWAPYVKGLVGFSWLSVTERLKFT